MRIAFLALEPVYSSKRLQEEAIKRGHVLDFIVFKDCKVSSEGIAYRGELLKPYDAAMPRIMPDLFDYGVQITRAFEKLTGVVMNTSESIEIAGNKTKTAQLLEKFNLPIPQTLIVASTDELDGAILKLGLPLVIKTSVGSHGAGVELAVTRSAVYAVVKKLLEGGQEFLLQEFIEESAGADIRVLVVGGKVVASMKRQARKGEFRSNLHLGGSTQQITLSPEEIELAVKATNALGLEYAGVDLIRSKRGPLVIELNASPGLEGIETSSGYNVAGAVIEHIELLVLKNKN